MGHIFFCIFLFFVVFGKGCEMGRSKFEGLWTDALNKVIASGTATVYKAGTTTLVSIYDSETATSAVSGSAVTTDSNGVFSFWVNQGQKVKVVLSKANHGSVTYDNREPQQSEYQYYADAYESDQGLEGNGFSVKAHVDTIGASSETIVFTPGTYTFSTSETIPANVTLDIQNGAVVSMDTGVTLTINGNILAGSYKWITTTGTGKVVISNSTKINTIWYSASGAGTSASPWVDTLRNAWASNGTRHHYYLPTGHYKDASTITIDDDYVEITGDGKGNSIIHYEVADGTPAIQFKESAAGIVNFVRMSGFEIDGGSAATGGAVYLEDVSDVLIENMWIHDFDGGTSAYGIKTAGRELVTIRKCYINSCIISILITHNPNSTIDADLFHFGDLILSAGDTTNGYGIKIEGDYVENFVWDGSNDITDMKYGLWFENSASGAHQQFRVSGLRSESGPGNTGWLVHFNPNDTVNNVIFTDCRSGGSYNGFYVRKATMVTFLNCMATNAATYTSYDVDTDGTSPLMFINSYADAAATLTIAGTKILDWSTGNYLAFVLYGGTEALLPQEIQFQGRIKNTIDQMTSGDATPSVAGLTVLRSDGTTTITDFDDGDTGQVFTFLAESSITITDGTNIFLNGSANFAMTDTDTLTLIQKSNGNWYELSRGDNGA